MTPSFCQTLNYITYNKHDRPCTYNVTLRRVRVTIVAVEKNRNKYYIFWVCVFSLSYPPCQAHGPHYTVIRGLTGSTIFLSTLRDMIFGKKVTEYKSCVLIFSTTFISNISCSKKNSSRYYHKCTQVFMQSASYYCKISMELEFSRQLFGTNQISN